jgi:hypothetical protein
MALCDVNDARLNGVRDEQRLQVECGDLPNTLVAEAVDVLVELIRASAARRLG